jgi:stage II sporulation protein D
LATLTARKLLSPVLRHEFLHALIEGHAAPSAPLWLREGLVEVWNQDAKLTGPPPSLRLDELDRALGHAATEWDSLAAHRAAGWYAQRLIARFGHAQVLGWLREGVPGSALAAIR